MESSWYTLVMMFLGFCVLAFISELSWTQFYDFCCFGPPFWSSYRPWHSQTTIKNMLSVCVVLHYNRFWPLDDVLCHVLWCGKWVCQQCLIVDRLSMVPLTSHKIVSLCSFKCFAVFYQLFPAVIDGALALCGNISWCDTQQKVKPSIWSLLLLYPLLLYSPITSSYIYIFFLLERVVLHCTAHSESRIGVWVHR